MIPFPSSYSGPRLILAGHINLALVIKSRETSSPVGKSVVPRYHTRIITRLNKVWKSINTLLVHALE